MAENHLPRGKNCIDWRLRQPRVEAVELVDWFADGLLVDGRAVGWVYAQVAAGGLRLS